MPRIGVILSGCGVFDGSEAYETVLTLLALDRAGASVVAMAPDVAQAEVVDHVTKQAVPERRNVLTESARLVRGEIRAVASVGADELDGVILPGGFGAAKNLCDFAAAGARAKVEPSVARLLRRLHEQKKPIAAVCIAPAVLAAVLRDAGVRGGELTIGDDRATAAALEAMGAKHVECPVDECRVDLERRLISTPAYMLAKRIGDAALGIERAVNELVRMAR